MVGLVLLWREHDAECHRDESLDWSNPEVGHLHQVERVGVPERLNEDSEENQEQVEDREKQGKAVVRLATANLVMRGLSALYPRIVSGINCFITLGNSKRAPNGRLVLHRSLGRAAPGAIPLPLPSIGLPGFEVHVVDVHL